MAKRKRLITILIVIAVVLLIVIYSGHRFIVCVTDCADKACALADYRPVSAEFMNTRINYECLSDEYKEAISYEQYTEADTPEELLALWSEDIFSKYPEIRVKDQFQSTRGVKKQDGVTANFEAGGKWYFLHHEVDLDSDFLTLETKIVRWYIEIREINKEDLPVLY